MKISKKILVLVSILVLALAVTACNGKPAEPATPPANETPTTPEPTPAELSGPLTVSGSTSVEKIGLALEEEFMALNPGVTATYESIGSSGGVKNGSEGVTQIGAASREIKDSEKATGIKEVIIAFDGIAVVAHPSNEATDLTMDQIKAIYKGEITNWSEVGGADKEIVVVSREDGSGTRGAFEEIVGFEGELTANALIAEGNGNVQTTVAGNEQAIGYISFSTINDTIKPLDVEGAHPTAENVVNKSYKVSRPFIFVYQEENLTDVSRAFLDFVLSADGQNIVEENGGIKVK